jgi:hypothetical protein
MRPIVIAAFLYVVLGGCKAATDPPAGKGVCWEQDAGRCESFREFTPAMKEDCARKGGESPTGCLTLDAVGSCDQSAGVSTIYYSQEKYSVEQAREDCSVREGFEFKVGPVD